MNAIKARARMKEVKVFLKDIFADSLVLKNNESFSSCNFNPNRQSDKYDVYIKQDIDNRHEFILLMDSSTFELPGWALWIAQDKDGAWWAYECEPLQHDTGWYENEVGRRVFLMSANGNSDWQSTLQKIVKTAK